MGTAHRPPLLGLWVLLATGQTTAALIGRVAKLEPHGEVEVKGRSEPVVAYRLVGLDEPGAQVGTVYELRPAQPLGLDGS